MLHMLNDDNFIFFKHKFKFVQVYVVKADSLSKDLWFKVIYCFSKKS